MLQRILIWDNDGTIVGSKDPNDATVQAKAILPNIEQTMNSDHVLNIICSGCKTPESELQNFNPQEVVKKFNDLMDALPITMAIFSPAIGGIECYAMIKKESGTIEIRKAHEDLRYKHLIGQFKKPGIGMLVVIQDLVKEIFDYTIDASHAIMIGDTWHDEEAAKSFGIPFQDAKVIHNLSNAS